MIRRFATCGWLLMLPLLGLTGCAELQTLRQRSDAQEAELTRLRQENAQFRDAYYKTKESLEGELAAQRQANDATQRQLEEARTLKTQNEKNLEDQLRTRTMELNAAKGEASDQKRASDAQLAQLRQDLQSTSR